MKQLKRIERKPLSRTKMKQRRQLLAFVDGEPNPLDGLDKSGSNEQRRKKELDAVGQAFSKASKQISKRYAYAGYGVDYCVLVFHDCDQVDAFLRGVGYPEPKEHYVDGTILADILGVALPAPKVEIAKLKRTQNPRLTRLAMRSPVRANNEGV
jgi:hypothetical protein